MNTALPPRKNTPKKHTARKTTPRLSSEERALIEKQLLRERARVLRSSAGLQELVSSSNSKIHGDLGDISSGLSARENTSLLMSREGARFREIEVALTRLLKEPEDFGICGVCGEAIPFERLELIPTTRTCQKHAS